MGKSQGREKIAAGRTQSAGIPYDFRSRQALPACPTTTLESWNTPSETAGKMLGCYSHVRYSLLGRSFRTSLLDWRGAPPDHQR